MGSTPSSNYLPSKEELFAFRVIQIEYNLLKDSLSSNDLSTRLERLYQLAKEECDCSPLDCREVSCLVLKLSENNRNELMNSIKLAIIEALICKESLKAKQMTSSDYSKGFSGTAADTKAEKDFEKLLRDEQGQDGDDFELYPVLRPPNILFPEHEQTLQLPGAWCRILTAQGCYMYCHALTRATSSFRPDDYQEEVVQQNDSATTTKSDPSNGLLSCHITNLPQYLQSLYENGEKKTPLLLDGTLDHQLLTFYSIKSMLEDVSSLVVPYATSGKKRTDIMEKCRQRLVSALKSGSLFTLYLGGVTIEHADFKTKLCKKDVFPTEVFQEWGGKLFSPKSNPKYKLLYREEDLDVGSRLALANDSFRFICVSTLSPFDYEEKLSESIPLGYMLPIYIHNLQP
jgi:hypothetical protein